MKNQIKKTVKTLFASVVLVAMMIACEKNPAVEQPVGILPDQFGIDIPNSISNNGNVSGRISNGRQAEDFLQGNDIYQNLETFIQIGEHSAELVEAIIISITKLGIDKSTILTYQSDDDKRDKNLVVVEGAAYEGVAYEFSLTITDADNESNNDGGYAMQIFWNRNPIKGVAIIKPANLDVVHDADAGEGIFKIEYDSESTLGYDAHMIVSIANLTLEQPEDNPYSMRTLKMFVGKTGDVVDVYGNSDHPNAKFFNDEVGFNWAFVAAGYDSKDLGIAEVGLPPSNLDESSREVLLDTYSIKNVFTNQIMDAFPNIDQDLLDLYLMNTAGPGYFTDEGFVAGGTPPSGLWDELATSIENLAPYNPSDISNLEINFKEE